MKQLQAHPTSVAPWSILALLILATTVSAQNPLVEYDEASRQLSVHAEEARLSDILNEVGKALNIEVDMNPRAGGVVTIDVENLPVQAALKELLTGYSYSLQQEPGADIPKRIWVLSQADPAAIEAARLKREREAARREAQERRAERAEASRQARTETDPAPVDPPTQEELDQLVEELEKMEDISEDEREELLDALNDPELLKMFDR